MTSEIIGQSDSTRQIREYARRVAGGEAKVLITGESGVGKDIVARFIHEQSARASCPFVAVNCAGLSETLLESELFGHVKGSFTGAYRDRIGRLRLAHRGTILLDEFGETSLRMQGLLLRFLENGEIQPVGSERASVAIDVRVIAATNRDLSELVGHGDFREDLLYRIKVVHIHVPPLRERIDDLQPLVAHLVRRMGRDIRFTRQALEVMERYEWPGNVRELQNIVEQVSWLGDCDEIGPEHLPESVRGASVTAATAWAPRARSVDDRYEALTSGRDRFWDDVYVPFLHRDLTRDDLRALVWRGLAQAGGNYRALLVLFGMPDTDYKRFLNFLAAHDCSVDFRALRPVRALTPFRKSKSAPPPINRWSDNRRQSGRNR